MTLTLYNTLSRKKEEFIPLESGRVTIYVCGPTTYNYIHLGNARPIVVFDTLRRYLEFCGYTVTYIQNFTDIDDKIIAKSRDEGLDCLQLSGKYIEEYNRDAISLNVRPADYHPRVSLHLQEIIEVIQKLVDLGYAYENGGSVYFRVRKFSDYGKLSGRSLDELLSGARVVPDPAKRDPLDFALWKKADQDEPAWASPWGRGRPGWHIECSTMAQKYLGPTLDIHGGGSDLIFPHHENEIAQAEALTGRPFARYWLHNGFITVNQEKMSKSQSNFFLVRDIISRYSPVAIRLMLLSTHYRSPLDFDPDKLEASTRGLERLVNCLRLVDEALADLENQAPASWSQEPGKIHGREVSDDSGGHAGSWSEGNRQPLTRWGALELDRQAAESEQAFRAALDDDFNTALALAALFDLIRETNSFINAPCLDREAIPALRRSAGVLRKLSGDVLGLTLRDYPAVSAITTPEILPNPGQRADLVAGLMELLMNVRQEARERRDWVTADRIRDGLAERGFILEDTPRGTRWKSSC